VSSGTKTYADDQELLKELIGRDLASVEFVRDYVQLRFDGPELTAYSWPTLYDAGRAVTRDAAGYCAALVALINQVVSAVTLKEGKELIIEWKNDALLLIDLSHKSVTMPEAVYFTLGDEHTHWMVL
jgi:hypothetical protein